MISASVLIIYAENRKIGIIYYACILATTIVNMLVLRFGSVSTTMLTPQLIVPS